MFLQIYARNEQYSFPGINAFQSHTPVNMANLSILTLHFVISDIVFQISQLFVLQVI